MTYALVAVIETADILRTQYELTSNAVINLLIDLLQRGNVDLLGMRTDAAIAFMLRARALPGRPLSDALIVAAAVEADALPLRSFDRDMHTYGVLTREPSGDLTPADTSMRRRRAPECSRTVQSRVRRAR